MIGGIVDLDLLFQIPQEYARIIGGIEREASTRDQPWWLSFRVLEVGKTAATKVEEGAFI